MNKNVKKWVKSLRSGEFKQGRRMLRTKNDEFCCLGVACEVYRRETGNGSWVNDEISSAILFDGAAGSLPSNVAEWLGLPYQAMLMHMNDQQRLDFNEIADYIEGEGKERLF